MRVQHPAPTVTECPVYACTMPVEEHDREQEFQGEIVVFHHDDSTGVTWPVEATKGSRS